MGLAFSLYLICRNFAKVLHKVCLRNVSILRVQKPFAKSLHFASDQFASAYLKSSLVVIVMQSCALNIVLLGGRVKQAKPFDGCHWLDLGGEFIHGEHTWAMRLAKKHGWGYEVCLFCFVFKLF